VDGQIQVWGLSDRKQYAEFEAKAWGRKQPLIWLDNDTLQFVHMKREIVEWKGSTQTMKTSHKLPSPGADWTLQSAGLALMRSDDGRITAWSDPRWDSGTVGQRANAIQADPSSFSVALHPEDRSQALIVDLASGESVKIGSHAIINCKQFAWSPKSRYLAIVGKGMMGQGATPEQRPWLYIVDRVSGKVLHREQVGANHLTSSVYATAVAWAPDESRVAAANQSGICEVLHLDGNELLRRQFSRPKHLARVRSLAWHPNGNRIASGSFDRSVQVWNSETGETLLSFQMEAPVHHVTWSPDGTKLAAMDSTGKVRIWDSNPGRDFLESNQFQSKAGGRFRSEFLNALSQRDWNRACDDLDRFLTLRDESDLFIHYQMVLLEVFLGRNQNATQRCQQIASRLSAVMEDEKRCFATWACALLPGAFENYDETLAVIGIVVDENPETQLYVTCLAAIQLRAGEYAEAKDTLNAAMHLESTELASASYAHYLMAMTQWHLGERESAADTLDQANRLADEEMTSPLSWNRELTIRVFQREAEQLIAPPADQ
jgi:WD40 repeat protein